MSKQISIPTLRRLPQYYNIVCKALDAGDKFISSAAIARMLDIDDTQVRKDIAATGYVGKPKVGFELSEFKGHLENYLGFNNIKEAFLVGVGNLGIALAKYQGFQKYGLSIPALFDTDPQKIGIKIANKEVYSIDKLPEMVEKMSVQLAILAVPVDVSQNVVDFLVKSGIKGIWNFAPANLNVPDDVIIWNQDLAASFITLIQLLAEKQR